MDYKKSQTFWNLAERLSFLYTKRMFKRPPKSIIIDATNFCNLKCPVCTTNFLMKRKRGIMSFSLFKSVIDDFAKELEKPRIEMNYAGEPLMNPKIDRLVKYAVEKGHDTLISTNATLLTREMSRRLVNSGLDRIYMCLDGIKKESHEAYRVGSDFEKVKRNIENFISVRNETGQEKPTAIILTLLTSYSENEMDQIVGWAKGAGADRVSFKSFSIGTYTTDEMKREYSYLLPKNMKLRRKTSNVYRTLCMLPARQSVVFWNGDLATCCIDVNGESDLPNISNGFMKTFTSDEVVEKRRLGFHRRMPFCKNCLRGSAEFAGINVDLKKG